MVFLTKMNGYKKTCDTNKNVTKMGVIIKGVYTSSLFVLFYYKSDIYIYIYIYIHTYIFIF
jgi:hypothetical protein